jgi:ATP-dependent DNA ligase
VAPTRQAARRGHAAALQAFDCLHAAGRDLRELELRARREWLEDAIHGHDLVLPTRRLADDGLTAWAEVLERGYEELVAKDPASSYVGGRTLRWLKVKQPHYREGERGWEPKAEARHRRVRATGCSYRSGRTSASQALKSSFMRITRLPLLSR